jgi:hypothetical protein
VKAELPQPTPRRIRRLPVRWSARRWRPRLVALGSGPTAARLLVRARVGTVGAAGRPLQARKSVRISFQPASISALDGAWGHLFHLTARSNPQYRFPAQP